MPCIAFSRIVSEDIQEARWDVIREPPHVQYYGGKPFASVGPGEGSPRVFVNGLPVIAMQAVESGDWVRIVGTDGAGLSFRISLQSGSAAEAGDNRLCVFTGLPIQGLAVRCIVCGRLYSQAAAGQIHTCVCGSSLDPRPQEPIPQEELL